MKCPKCKGDVVYVLDSRPAEIDGVHTTRRRRICRACKFRWSTHEVLIGDFRHHNAIRLLDRIKKDLQEALTKIDEFQINDINKGGGNEIE